jgi:hypothetical protein
VGVGGHVSNEMSAVSIAALVKHHPLRTHLLPALVQGLAPLPTTVVTDPGADEPRRSCWRCLAECLARIDELPDDVTHVLIVEDDVIVCSDFAAGLERIVEARPSDLLALWVSRNHGAAATAIDVIAPLRPNHGYWFRLVPTCVPVVALLFPRGIAEHFRDWAIDNPQPWSWLDDNKAVTNFIRAERIRLLAPIPSLVEHPDVEPSVLTGEPGRRRTGFRYIGSCSPLTLDWSRPAKAEPKPDAHAVYAAELDERLERVNRDLARAKPA